jgi:hypothetical protein
MGCALDKSLRWLVLNPAAFKQRQVYSFVDSLLEAANRDGQPSRNCRATAHADRLANWDSFVGMHAIP